MNDPKCPTCGAPNMVTLRPATAIVRGVRYAGPPLPTVTPGPDGAVRDSDGNVIAYVTAKEG